MIEFRKIDDPPAKKARPAEKIVAGLKEALAVAKGKAEPHKVHKPKRSSTAKKGSAPVTAARAKKLISIRLDQDVIDHFKSQGTGWQSRVNAELRKASGLAE